MKLLKWACYIIMMIMLILLSALLMEWSIQHIPIFKQIGVALGLNTLSIIDYFLGVLGYTFVYGISKVILWFFKFIINDVLGD